MFVVGAVSFVWRGSEQCCNCTYSEQLFSPLLQQQAVTAQVYVCYCSTEAHDMIESPLLTVSGARNTYKQTRVAATRMCLIEEGCVRCYNWSPYYSKGPVAT